MTEPIFEPIKGTLPAPDSRRPPAPPLLRGSRAGHPARVPAHRGRRRPPVPPSAERRGDHAPLPRARLRHAVARQVAAAGRLAGRGVPSHHAAATSSSILAFCDALGLERPVVLGCSIGGKIVLELARTHPERFRALIGLESAAYQPPWYDDTGWLHRPDVHGGELCGALMSGLIAPQSPDETRWDTLWGYMQGGPGVFKGDLHFYRVDGDFRDRVGQIDTARCPLYLLTGEYDFSCTPEDTRAHRREDPRRALHGHDGDRPLPDERESRRSSAATSCRCSTRSAPPRADGRGPRSRGAADHSHRRRVARAPRPGGPRR